MNTNGYLFSHAWSEFRDVLKWSFLKPQAAGAHCMFVLVVLQQFLILYSFSCRSWRPHLWRRAAGTCRRNPWRAFELNVLLPWSIHTLEKNDQTITYWMNTFCGTYQIKIFLIQFFKAIIMCINFIVSQKHIMLSSFQLPFSVSYLACVSHSDIFLKHNWH